MEPLLKSENEIENQLTHHSLSRTGEVIAAMKKVDPTDIGKLSWAPPIKGGSVSSPESVENHHYQPLAASPPNSSNGSTKSSPFCRICHEGDMANCSGNSPLCSSSCSPAGSSMSRGSRREPLIAPCRCTGSVAMVHLSCLEHWLTTSNSDKCELCSFVYKIRRIPRSWTDFLTESDNQFNVRNMIADIVCFFLLTPLLVVSTYLCALGAHQYYIRERWEAVGLITLSIFLLMVYFTWCQVTLRYHISVWRTWARTHQRICIIFGDGTVGQYFRRISHSHEPINTANMNSLQEI